MEKIYSPEEYLDKNPNWNKILVPLRNIMLETGLKETIKWNMPVYTYKNKNLIGLVALKNYVSLWFFEGVLLKDKKNILVSAKGNNTKAQRQWRFTKVSEINKNQINNFAQQAVLLVNQGVKVPMAKKKPLVIPVELQEKFKDNKKLKDLFESHSLTNKREFCEYIIQAKKEATKIRRLEKIIPMILANVGLNDKYKNC
jgi:uncharacterized protein YdeI (YjbR/CyaY-like superfamily)